MLRCANEKKRELFKRQAKSNEKKAYNGERTERRKKAECLLRKWHNSKYQANNITLQTKKEPENI